MKLFIQSIIVALFSVALLAIKCFYGIGPALSVLGLILVAACVIFLMAPVITRSIMESSVAISTYPKEFPGRYYRVTSPKRFILSVGFWPWKHIVFFNYMFIRDLPKGSVAFAIAHEFAHRKYAHHWKVFLLNISSWILAITVPGIMTIEGSFNWITIIVVSYFSIIFFLGTQWIIRAIRFKYEFRADHYAKQQLNSTPREVYKLLTYMSSAKKGYSHTHPDIKARMIKLFPGIDLTQFTT
jgi:hypothetical protein